MAITEATMSNHNNLQLNENESNSNLYSVNVNYMQSLNELRKKLQLKEIIDEEPEKDVQAAYDLLPEKLSKSNLEEPDRKTSIRYNTKEFDSRTSIRSNLHISKRETHVNLASVMQLDQLDDVESEDYSFGNTDCLVAQKEERVVISENPVITPRTLEIPPKKICLSNSKLGLQNHKYELSNTKLGINNTPFGLSNTQLGLSNTRMGINNAQLGVSNTQLNLRNPQMGLSNTKLGIRNSKLGLSSTKLVLSKSKLRMHNSQFALPNAKISLTKLGLKDEIINLEESNNSIKTKVDVENIDVTRLLKSAPAASTISSNNHKFESQTALQCNRNNNNASAQSNTSSNFANCEVFGNSEPRTLKRIASATAATSRSDDKITTKESSINLSLPSSIVDVEIKPKPPDVRIITIQDESNNEESDTEKMTYLMKKFYEPTPTVSNISTPNTNVVSSDEPSEHQSADDKSSHEEKDDNTNEIKLQLNSKLKQYLSEYSIQNCGSKVKSVLKTYKIYSDYKMHAEKTLKLKTKRSKTSKTECSKKYDIPHEVVLNPYENLDSSSIKSRSLIFNRKSQLINLNYYEVSSDDETIEDDFRKQQPEEKPCSLLEEVDESEMPDAFCNGCFCWKFLNRR